MGNQLGEQLAETLIEVAFGLSRCWWQRDYKNHRPKGILDQEVDKFALLLVNTKEIMGIAKGPVIIAQGRHGSGIALPGTNGHLFYIGDLFEHFLGDLPMEKRLLCWQASEDGPWRYFEPRGTRTDWDGYRERMIENGDSHRLRIIEEFSVILEGLEPRQVIALGRHPNATETIRAIQKLQRQCKVEFLSFLEHCEGTHPIWSRHLCEAYEIAHVAHDKATSDRELYRTARQHVINVAESETKTAILRCRSGDQDIWENRAIREELKPLCETLYLLMRIVWTAAQVWADRVGERIPGRRVPEPAAELAVLMTQWNSSPAGKGFLLPTQVLKEGVFKACVEELRQLIGRVVP